MAVFFEGFSVTNATFVRRLLGAGLAALVFAMSELYANTETPVHTGNGHVPYLVVTEDKEGGSTRAPGIYAASGPDYVLIAPGNVLRGGATVGVVRQLASSNSTGRYEAVSVVDGKILIYNIGSRPDIKGSILEIGSRHLPVLNPFTHAAIDIPRISSLDDVSVTSLQSPEKYRRDALMISVKYPTIYGSGLTFALSLPLQERGDGAVMRSAGKAILVDYNFHSARHLNTLFADSPEGTRVLSESLLRYVLKSRKSDDFAVVRSWYDKIGRTIGLIKQQELKVTPLLDGEMPYFEADTLEYRVPAPPVISVRVGNVIYQQTVDRVARQNRVRAGPYNPSGKPNERLVFEGDIDTWAGSDRSQVEPPFAIARSQFDNHGMVASLNNGNLVYCHVADDRAYKVSLVEGNQIPSQISYSIMSGTGQEGKIILFLSTKYPTGATGTTAYVLVDDKSTVRIEKRLHLSDEFYTPAILGERIKKVGDKVGFDRFIPRCESREEYRARYKEISPLVDIMASTESKQEIIFGRPITTEVISPKASHFEYDDALLTEKKTGLYIEGHYPHFYPGDLLGFVGGSKRDHVILRKTLKIVSNSNPPLRGLGSLTVIALDPKNQKGKDGFQLLFLLTSVKKSEVINASESAISTQVFSTFIDRPFEKAAGIQVFQGGGNYGNEVTAVIKIDQNPQAGQAAETFAHTFSFYESADSKSGFAVRCSNPVRIAQQVLSPKVLDGQIHIAKNGRLYLVKGPLDPSDPKFSIVELATGNESRGNVESLNLQPYSALRTEADPEDSDSFGETHKYPTWMHMNSNGLVNYLQQNNHYFNLLATKEEKQKEKKEKEKEKKERRDLDGKLRSPIYEGLAQRLDELANPASPKKHIVFIVNKRLQDQAVQAALDAMARTQKSSSIHWQNSPTFSVSYLKGNLANQKEYFENLTGLRRRNVPGEVAPLIVDSREIGKNEYPAHHDGEVFYSYSDPSEPNTKIPAHFLQILANEGANISPFDQAEPPQNQIPMVIFANPSDWQKYSDTLKRQGLSNILDRFEVDRTFNFSDLRRWGPESEFVRQDEKTDRELPPSKVEENILPGFLDTARSLVDPNHPNKFQVFIAEDDLVQVMQRRLLKQWTSSLEDEPWNYKNKAFFLHELGMVGFGSSGEGSLVPPQTLDQESLITAIRAAHSSDERKSVVIGSLKNLLAMDRIRNSTETSFTIHDPATESDEEVPHVLYLLGTGGRKVEPEVFQKLKSGPRDFSMLLVGTPQEWEMLRRKVMFEQRFGLLDLFEIREIPPPTVEDRMKLLAKVMEVPQIQKLNFAFRLGDKQFPAGSKEGRDSILRLAINRAENLAKQSDQNIITSFINFHRAFQRALVEDQEVRKTGVLDRSFVERLVTRVFNIPLNPQILPDTDPLVRMSNVRRAAFDLQQVGYAGTVQLRERIIRAMLAQTKSDQVRAIPSSVILYGESSTGKTFLFESVMNMLGYSKRIYSFDANANNEDAVAFIFKCGKISEKAGDGGDILSVDEIKSLFYDFLAGPNGSRGYILFDDLHKAPPAVRKELLALINSLFEAPRGLFQIPDHDVPIPVKNLTLYLTVNPPADRSLLKKYAPNDTAEEKVVAGLAVDGVPIEISFVKRWTTVINLDQFPTEAKAPGLLLKLREASQLDFNGSGKLTLVSPESVRNLVSHFQTTNARDFLGEATAHLLSMAQYQNGSLFLIRPKESLEIPVAFPVEKGTGPSWGDTGRSDIDIQNFLNSRNSVVALDAPTGITEGKVTLAEILVDSFRNLVYESFANQAQSEEDFVGTNIQDEMGVLAPLLHSLTTNLVERPYLPAHLLRLEPAELRIQTPSDVSRFRSILASRRARVPRFFPIQFSDEIIRPSSETEERGRIHLLTEISDKIVEVLKDLLKDLAQVRDLKKLPTPQDWAVGLNEVERGKEVREAAMKLVHLYSEFVVRLARDNLAESKNMRPSLGGKVPYLSPSFYDSARLFYFALDRAIARQPWGRLTELFYEGLRTSAADASLGQSPGLQHYLFKNKYSLIVQRAQEITMQIAAGSKAYERWATAGFSEAHAKGFPTRCEYLFSPEVYKK